ncbi:MAG: class I SAM-dependent methyltransferase [Deltaproteobacteria bacterium]|nr:class I SAM-dependent methyltransferase [Deltaproteobacteria bacterium]MBI3390987.1 class I SAM-dependent methyltransferase [Deltaproteobacteria bacterium]
MNAKDAFDADAAIYDRSRRQLVPGFDAFYRTAIEAIPFQPDAAIRVLDLGAGTGLLSSFVLAAFPQAQVTLADISEEMLAQARARFAGSAAVEFVVMDFGRATLPGSFDLVISALAIHHLSHDDKQRLFRAVFAALRAGGAFINADQALGPTPAAEARHQAMWLRSAQANGVSDADLAAALERMRADRSATLADQSQWLADAGFRDVDCWYKHYRFAVFGGFK